MMDTLSEKLNFTYDTVFEFGAVVRGWSVDRPDWLRREGQQLESWSSFSSALFVVIGMTLGERHTPDGEKLAGIYGSVSLRAAITVWMMATFVVIAGYNGALRTFLLAPSLENVIETYTDILQSGLPWGMVLYGIVEETQMSESNDSVIKQIWNGKTNISGDTYNASVELEQVWSTRGSYCSGRNDLDFQSYIGFTTPTGDPLLHISKFQIRNEALEVWFFNTFNPWFDIFQKNLRHMVEGRVDRLHHFSAGFAGQMLSAMGKSSQARLEEWLSSYQML
ncbi:unnamed protein product [Sphagnum tenellum]